MQGQNSEYRDICTVEVMSLTLSGSVFVMRTHFHMGMFMQHVSYVRLRATYGNFCHFLWKTKFSSALFTRLVEY